MSLRDTVRECSLVGVASKDVAAFFFGLCPAKEAAVAVFFGKGIGAAGMAGWAGLMGADEAGKATRAPTLGAGALALTALAKAGLARGAAGGISFFSRTRI